MKDNFILNNFDFSKIEAYDQGNYLVKQISPSDLFFTSQSMKNFDWNHNNSNFNITQHRVNNISKVENLLSRGFSIDDIKQSYPHMRMWIDDAFSHNVIRVYQDRNGNYIHTGDDGRHRSLMAKILNIPLLTVTIVGETGQSLTELAGDVINNVETGGNVFFDTLKNNVVDRTSISNLSVQKDKIGKDLDNKSREIHRYVNRVANYNARKTIHSFASHSNINQLNIALENASNISLEIGNRLEYVKSTIFAIESLLYYHFYDEKECEIIIGNLIDSKDYISKSMYKLLEFKQKLENYKTNINF